MVGREGRGQNFERLGTWIVDKEPVEQTTASNSMAQSDELNCIKFHEEVNGWDISFGLTNSAFKGNASVDTICYLLDKDYAIPNHDLTRCIVVYNRQDVFETLPAYMLVQEPLLEFAIECDRIWVLDWFAADQIRQGSIFI